MITNMTRWLLAGLMCLVLWPGTTQGQSTELMEAHNKFSELYAQGRYQEALPFAEMAVRLGEDEFGPDHPVTATLLNNLALLYDDQGKYGEAEPLYQPELANREKALGPEHRDVAQGLENYAALLRKTGRGVEATKMEARAKVIRAKHAEQNPAN